MPGVIGGNGGSFVLVAATLLLRGWVDDDKARIAIVPGAPTSAISPTLAERVERAGRPDVKIELRAESFRAPVAAVEEKPAGDADIRIGQDILAGQAIEIDFPHHAVQPLSISEARRVERGFDAIPVERAPDGSLSVLLSIDEAAPMRARLDLASPTGIAGPGLTPRNRLSIGPVALRAVEASDAPQVVVGLYAFRHMRVIFDLRHDRIWVRA